ncbi:MAG TPA: hypothetical protein VMV29_01330, partial [Ktedonobacterales bacterium]|nr:hypothetical protein [Ktedonobacterales bacterium]
MPANEVSDEAPGEAPRRSASRAPRSQDGHPVGWRIWHARRRVGPFAVAGLALGRLARNGGVLALLALGMLVADTLIGVVPLYTTLVADVQLQAALSAHGSVARNIE